MTGQRPGTARLTPLAVFALACALCMGCQDDREAVGQMCIELEEAVSLRSDCEQLGTDVAAMLDDHDETLARVLGGDDGGEPGAWRVALEPCYRAQLEASLKVCADNPELTEALARFE